MKEYERLVTLQITHNVCFEHGTFLLHVMMLHAMMQKQSIGSYIPQCKSYYSHKWLSINAHVMIVNGQQTVLLLAHIIANVWHQL